MQIQYRCNANATTLATGKRKDCVDLFKIRQVHSGAKCEFSSPIYDTYRLFLYATLFFIDDGLALDWTKDIIYFEVKFPRFLKFFQ